MKTFSEKDGYDRFVSTSKAAGEPWNKEINFHFECVEGDGFPENQEIFIFYQKFSVFFASGRFYHPLLVFSISLCQFFGPFSLGPFASRLSTLEQKIKFKSHLMNHKGRSGQDGEKNITFWVQKKMVTLIVKMLVVT